MKSLSKHVYFLGIGGTLIGNIAILAQESGYQVSGFDGKIYPPMSDLLDSANIKTYEGFSPDQLKPRPDHIVIGNANLPRGEEPLEYILNEDFTYSSGAQWLSENILQDKHVFAVAGTHGKTSTTGILSWILEETEKEPGFLVGGIPLNFERASRLGGGNYFVIEADEYDTSYFDRRAKFMHYRPKTMIINNLEYDHADIYADLAAIQYQFEHLIRTVPGNGRIVVPWGETSIEEVLAKGCWTPVSHTLVNPTQTALNEASKQSQDLWVAQNQSQDGSVFSVSHNGETIGTARWEQFGLHNVKNALGAIVASQEAGVDPVDAIEALSSYQGIKRRMERFANAKNVTFYDDFAHHPTAIEATLQGLRQRVGTDRIVAVIEPRTHTMQQGAHLEKLKACCTDADETYWFDGPNVKMDLTNIAQENSVPSRVYGDIEQLVEALCTPHDEPTHVVLMSNGGFGGIYEKISNRLA